MKKHSLNFGALLRRWRNTRRFSQLDLALTADISTRHLSCIETGRAQPSREMTLRLAEALSVPLRERNTMLLAAGFAPVYRETALDAPQPEIEAAHWAVDFLLAQHDPYPAIVIDRYWNALKMNAGAKHFLALFSGRDLITAHNGPRLVLDPQGLRPFVENWESVAARIIRRVHREAMSNPADDGMKRFLDELLRYPNIPTRWSNFDFEGAAPPFSTIDYKVQNVTYRWISVLTTFGTAQDIALQELRIESFFPADDATRALVSRSAEKSLADRNSRLQPALS
ncbi:MAG: helix-turn-helix domain-containing protein [Rhizomicrobium sp.]